MDCRIRRSQFGSPFELARGGLVAAHPIMYRAQFEVRSRIALFDRKRFLQQLLCRRRLGRLRVQRLGMQKISQGARGVGRLVLDKPPCNLW